MAVSENTIDLLIDFILTVLSGQYGLAYPGRSNGAGGYEIEALNNPGKWWCRVVKNDVVSISQATPLGVPRDPQQRCRTLVINGELCLVGADPATLRQLYGNYANSAAVGNIPTVIEGTDKDALGAVRPSASGGMKVSVGAYPAGGLYSFADGIDLTTDEPGGSGEFLWDVAYLDTDGTIHWVQSSAITTTGPSGLVLSTARAVTIPTGARRLYAVSLGNGQTDITQSRFANLQDDLVPTDVLAIDTSAATSGDIATWNGTAWVADPPSGGGGGGDQITIEEQLSTSTDAGTFTSGSWVKRALNTIVNNVGGHASLSGNQITLPNGTYRLNAWAQAFRVAENQTQFYNTTDSVVVAAGSNEYAHDANSGSSKSTITDVEFTVSGGPKVFELQHQCVTTHSGNGLGVSNAFGSVMVYSGVSLLKIS